MEKLNTCSASFDCTECVHYVTCQKRARIRRLKKRARLAVFYVLYPFVWMIDFICKLFSSRAKVVVAIFAIAIALAFSGFTSTAISDDPKTVLAANPSIIESLTESEDVLEVEQSEDTSSLPAEEVVVVTPAEEIAKASEAALREAEEAAALKAQEEEEARKQAEAEAAAKAEAERLAQIEAEATQLHENIFVRSQELADQMGLPSDYDPILAMYGMKYLVQEEGFSVEGAAGLIGNVYSECRFDLDADNGSHFGIFQWDYWDRWPRISGYLEENGVSHYSRHQDYSFGSKEEECENFVWQLRAALHSSDAQYYSDTISRCKSDSDASSSADRWRAYYEVCGGAQYERMEYAEYTATLYYTIF